MTGETGSVRKRAGAGCLVAGVLFGVVFAAVWLAAVTLYGIVVEQWELIRERHDFTYDWTFIYAPLFAAGCGLAVAFWAMRRRSAVRITMLALVAGLIALFGGILFFGLGGLM